MANRFKIQLPSNNDELRTPITKARNVLFEDGQNLQDLYNKGKESGISPIIENSNSFFKVGKGNNVNYNENVINGYYENCILKGKTKYIDNDNGEILDSFEENRDLSLIDCKSPILINMNQNIFDKKLSEYDFGGITGNNSNTIITDNYIEWNSNKIYNDTVFYYFYVEPNTEYTLTFESNMTGKFRGTICDDFVTLRNTNRITYISTSNNITTFTTISNKITISFDNGNIINQVYKIWNVQLSEETNDKYELHKSNIISTNKDIIKLTENMFEQGGASNYGLNVSYNEAKTDQNNRIRLKKLHPCKPNTAYIINNDSNIGNYDYNITGYDINGLGINTSYNWIAKNTVIVTPSNMNYFGAIVRRKKDAIINVSKVDFNKFQIRELDKTVVLRSLPNGIYDILDITNSKYTQRIKELILKDGFSEDKNFTTDTHKTYTKNIPDLNSINSYNDGLICDKLPVIKNPSAYTTENIEGIIINSKGNQIALRIENSRLKNYSDINEYLTEKSITIQYQLANPIIKIVDLENCPFAYQNGYIKFTSGTFDEYLIPDIEYSIPIHYNGQIRSNQSMIEKQQKQLDHLQSIILANLINSQYNQTLTMLHYELSRV